MELEDPKPRLMFVFVIKFAEGKTMSTAGVCCSKRDKVDRPQSSSSNMGSRRVVTMVTNDSLYELN